MYPRDLIFSALLISIVHFSKSTDVQSEKRTLMQFLKKPLINLEDIPDRWKIVQPEFKEPQIEMYFMKDYASPNEDWTFNKEYKYSNKDHDAAKKMTSTRNEKKISQIGNAKENEKENFDGAQDNIVMPDRIIPQIGSRNIIVMPTFCPQGQKKDRKGTCRDIMGETTSDLTKHIMIEKLWTFFYSYLLLFSDNGDNKNYHENIPNITSIYKIAKRAHDKNYDIQFNFYTIIRIFEITISVFILGIIVFLFTCCSLYIYKLYKKLRWTYILNRATTNTFPQSYRRLQVRQPTTDPEEPVTGILCQVT